MSDLATRLTKAESDSGRLSEENERLSEQLASNVERPVAEGQESGRQVSFFSPAFFSSFPWLRGGLLLGSLQNGVENGHPAVRSDDKFVTEQIQKAAAASDEWQNKYQLVIQEKDDMWVMTDGRFLPSSVHKLFYLFQRT